MSNGLRVPRAVLVVYVALIAIAAYDGAAGLMAGFLPLGTLADRLPFHSTLLAGVALAVVVGLPQTLVGVLAWRRDPRAPRAARWAGVALVAWIVVEVAVVRELSPLQPLFGLAGLGLVLVGLPQRRPRPRPELRVPLAPGIDLYWIPLGAAGQVVRWSGKAYERLTALREHRPPADLYHAALEITEGGHRYAVEMAPVWEDSSPERGVVCEGPVGSPLLGRLPAFRYEVRRWRDGVIPDLGEAVGGACRVSDDPERAAAVLALLPAVPALTWGRDDLGAGEMWNSNSVVAWVLACAGVDLEAVHPPAHGRAPGWLAGLALAALESGRSEAVLVE